MSNYRNKAIDPRMINTILVTGELGYRVMSLTGVDFRKIDRAQYLLWVTAWKEAYNHITDMNRELRKTTDDVAPQSDRHRAEHHLRILSNTLLNVRQYAKDVRRGLRQTA